MSTERVTLYGLSEVDADILCSVLAGVGVDAVCSSNESGSWTMETGRTPEEWAKLMESLLDKVSQWNTLAKSCCRVGT